MASVTRRIDRAQAALVVIDLQERLLPAMHEKERVAQNSWRLARAASILALPVVVTEQYRKGIGPTVAELASAVPGFSPLEKLTFSCWGAEGFAAALRAREIRDVILCGIEAHVCVMQTCLDLLDEGFRPFVVADAISSRSPENLRWGLERMRDSGGVVVSTEMILFELLGCAGTAEFKQMLDLIK